MESRVRGVRADVMRIDHTSLISLSLLGASLFACLVLLQNRPPIGLAAPTGVFWKEASLILVAFVSLLLLVEPAKVFTMGRFVRLHRAFDHRLNLPLAARLVAVIAVLVGLFNFTFWAAVDVLGGYDGTTWSFKTHPYLRAIYNLIGMRYFGSWGVGNQAFSFFCLALMGLFMLASRHGIGAAAKDVATLFAAPILIAFELSLWFSAPGDMTWHVIDVLWMGGVNDLGWRAFDGPTGGAFIFSNWLVLLIALLLLASRLPYASLPSRTLWKVHTTARGIKKAD